MKVKLQTSTHYTGLNHVFSDILKKEGLTGFYRGVQSPLTGLFAMNAALFSAYGWAKRLIGETPATPLDNAGYWKAGFIAGFCVAFVEGPVDLFKCQLQTRPAEYKGFVNCATSILSQRGIAGAYQGIIPTLWRNAPSNAAWYGMYEWAREAQLKEGQTRKDLAQWQVMLAGGAGGMGYWCSIYPIDVIKTTIQSDNPDPAQRKYRGMLDASRQIYFEHGVRGFFRGLAPCLLRAFPANAATFVAYEAVISVLDKNRE
eukprot:TRINITY_DN16793_c0_g1_i1.p1 TRINITY_DN16793_c0_g1~~TRINITY_DN16793_c0_g1_i1.p1  ORF type:complete len:288 (-),score=72.56 TRINITY_DN16793_c0_g1_i1:25-798(-)